jgi:ADP-ribose pyrophosphatase
MRNLKEKSLKSKNVFKGRFLNVFQDEVSLPNGEKSIREFIKHPGVSACIPLLPDNKIALVKQHRYSINEETIEIPAGKLHMNEDPKNCALRELEEELGFKAKKITYLTKIHPAVGFCDEVIWLYLAEELTRTSIKHDVDEFLEFIPIRIEDLLNMIKIGVISDAKTIIGMLWFEKYHLNRM